MGDTNSGVLYFDNLRVKYPVVIPILDGSKSDIPPDYQLFQNYPNPFNPTTTIQYKIPHTGQVWIEIFDLPGRKVDTLVKDKQ